MIASPSSTAVSTGSAATASRMRARRRSNSRSSFWPIEYLLAIFASNDAIAVPLGTRLTKLKPMSLSKLLWNIVDAPQGNAGDPLAAGGLCHQGRHLLWRLIAG